MQLRRKSLAVLVGSLAPEQKHMKITDKNEVGSMGEGSWQMLLPASSSSSSSSALPTFSSSASASLLPSSSSSSSSWDEIWLQAQAACAAQRLEQHCWTLFVVGVAARRPQPESHKPSRRSAGKVEEKEELANLRGYRAKMRFLSTNFKRLRGSALHQQLLDGSLRVEDVLQWREEVFLSSERRRDRERSRQEALRSTIVSSAASFGLFSELLECPQCSHLGANYALPTFTGHWSMKHETGKAVLARCPSCHHQWQQQEGF